VDEKSEMSGESGKSRKSGESRNERMASVTTNFAIR
jgi:hypothetical protein